MIESGNPTLDKNLECIEKYNPQLVQAILKLPYLTNRIELIETELKEPNLSYNGLPLHAQSGAEAEAQSVFAKTKNSPHSIHIIFGIGIGHLFKEFCQRSKGVVYLYEPNLEILRVTLELVDFSKELSQPNVKAFAEIQTFKDTFVRNFKYGSGATFSFLGTCNQIYGNIMGTAFKQMETIMGACMADYNTLRQEGMKSISTTFENISDTLEETPLIEIKDIYKGKTALIVSAGPSLDLNIETIKKNRDKVVIFCVGTAFKALAKHGITPDFLNLIETNDCSGQVKGFDLSEINLILEPYTNPSIHKLKVKKKFLFPSNAGHANNYWSNITGIDISPYISKGTVSYEALTSAQMLGCTKMVLVGQDLAYVNNKCYSDDAAYSELAFEINPETNKPEFKIKDEEKYAKSLLPTGVDEIQPWCKGFQDYKIQNLNETLYYVKGINGKMLPTQGGYATFLEHFREFSLFFGKELELINSSMIGAQIEGFKNVELEEALKDSPLVEKVDLYTSFKYDREKVLENLGKEREVLKEILKEFVKANEYIFKYEREFHRRKTITAESNKFFKNLLGLYDKITIEHYDKNPLYQALAFNENLELQYVIKETEVVDVEKIKLVYSLLKIYFQEVEKKVVEVVEKIKKQKEII